MDALEDFHPARIADRILGMGDIVSLVEKAATSIDREQAMRAAERMRKGQFDLTDMREQLAGMAKMGGMSGLMAMMPGVAKIKSQMAERNLDDGVLKRQMAIIDSMTPGERKHPDILKASRKKRIAAGAGSKVEEVNKLLKMHRTMADMMKAMGGGKARGPMAGLARMMGMGGGMPSPEEMAKLAEKMPGGLPPGMPGLPPTMPGGSGLPGLGKFPGLGGGSGKLPTPGGLPADFFRRNEFQDLTNATNADQSRERTSNASRYPHGPRRNQEAAVLSHRRRRQPLPARRPLHRASRLLQSAAAEGQGRAPQARLGQGQGLDGQRARSRRIA
jgi:signal recognition particle subunit SRP54